jgi:hypothetical protein
MMRDIQGRYSQGRLQVTGRSNAMHHVLLTKFQLSASGQQPLLTLPHFWQQLSLTNFLRSFLLSLLQCWRKDTRSLFFVLFKENIILLLAHSEDDVTNWSKFPSPQMQDFGKNITIFPRANHNFSKNII